jgi:hypothetical protein
MKRFDNETEPNEFMDMPCRCDCGNWFDLTDGYSNGTGKVVCGDCYENVKEIKRLKDEYYELDSGDKPYKREKAKILKQLKAMGEEL